MATLNEIAGDLGNANLFPAITASRFSTGTTAAEHSVRVETKFSPTAPLREPCAQGRHYACGSKGCSCSCHLELEKKSILKKHPIAFVLSGLFVLAIAVLLLAVRGAEPSSQPTAQLSQPAIKLASYVLIDDIQAGLLDGQSVIATTPGEDLLAWAELDRKTTARAYENAYDNNEIAADNTYKGKKILLSGAVARVEKDFTGKGNVWLRGSGLLGVHAQLSEHGMAGAASFDRGQQVNLVCNGSGLVLTVATLDNCEPLSDYLKSISPSIEAKITDFLTGKTPLRAARANMVTALYVTGLSFPSDSPCIRGESEKCPAELNTLFNDKAKMQAIKNQAKQMMASLKVK